MSDTADAGSVVQPDAAASAGTPATQDGGADNGSAAPPASDPFAGLSEDTRSWIATKGYKSPEDIVTAYRNAEQKLGSSINPPKEDAPREDWDKFYSKLGRPEAPDKYEFKRTEGLPENLPWNAEAEAAFKQWAYEDGLTPRQAQGQLDKFARYQADQFKAAQARVAKDVEAAHDDLVKEWGPTDSEGFKAKQALMDRAAKKLGVMEALQQGGLVLPDGAVTNAQLARALAVVGETMFKDDVIGADGIPVTENPFKRGPDGQRNLQGITALKRSDPERAKRLAREAGENPLDWGLH